MTDTHLAEVATRLRECQIASRILDIALETSAAYKAIDGRVRTGPLAGRTVNVKWLLKREGGLHMTTSLDLEYYLVLTSSSTSDTSASPG